MSASSWGPPGYRPGKPYGQLRDAVQAGTRFEIEGEGPAVLLIHGVGLDLHQWDPIAADLARDHTVIRYDLWGHGGSQKPLSQLRLRDYVSQVADLADYLKLGRFVLVGFSLGALIAQGYALARSERLVGLCLMNSVYQRSAEQRAAVEARLALAESEGPQAIIEAALSRWMGPAYRADHPEVEEALRARLLKNDRQGFLSAYRVFASADAELAGRLFGIACPALVMTGAKDRGSTPAMSEALAAELPDAEVEILEGLAHLAPLEGAEACARRLRRFLVERCG